MSAHGRDSAAAPASSRTAAAEDTPPRRTAGQVVKDILLFVAAPFITLAYLVLFPFIGMTMLFRKDGRVWREWHATK